MSETVNLTIIKHFEELPDPRQPGKVEHKLSDILVIAICGIICGADDWVSIEEFGKTRLNWFSQFLDLPNGIPSHDTFGRVFSLLNPVALGRCFVSWTRAVVLELGEELIAFDGKVLRRSHDRANGKNAISMVSAWATQNRMVLGQLKVDDKSNEITAIPELLRALALKGCIVTIDAMGCQRKIVEQIVEQGGDYVISLKGNQGTLHQEVEELFEKATDEDTLDSEDFDYYETEESGHGREEWRRYWVTKKLDDLTQTEKWQGLRTVVMVERERVVNEKRSYEASFYISSLEQDAKKIGAAIRGHWGIENSLHWVLDLAFREDESRIRKGYASENMAVLRHIATNMLRQTKAKVGIKNRRLKAGWDSKFLGKILSFI